MRRPRSSPRWAWPSATTRCSAHLVRHPEARQVRHAVPDRGSPFDPENVWPNHIFDAAAKLPKPPKTIAIVTSKFPSVHAISVGAREVMKKRGLTEVLHLEYEFGNRDYGAIASRVKEANPDFLWGGTNGIDRC